MLLSVPNLISDTLESSPNLRAVSHEPQSDFSPMSRDDRSARARESARSLVVYNDLTLGCLDRRESLVRLVRHGTATIAT